MLNEYSDADINIGIIYTFGLTTKYESRNEDD